METTIKEMDKGKLWDGWVLNIMDLNKILMKEQVNTYHYHYNKQKNMLELFET